MSNDVVNYLRDKVTEYRRTAAQNKKTVADLEERATRYRDLAAKHTTEADYWQRLLDFLVLSDSDEGLSCAFADAIARRDAEMDAARDVTAAVLLSSSPLAVAFGTDPDLIGAMARHTSTHGTTAANAEEYRVGDLVNVSQPKHPHWGTRGKVVGFTDDIPALVAVEYDNLGNCLYLAPSQLMHHTAFVEQESRAEFEAERTSLAEQLRAVGADQAAQDAEADDLHAQQRADEAESNGEYFDAVEAADVSRIQHDMNVEAGMECDPETCAFCGGAR